MQPYEIKQQEIMDNWDMEAAVAKGATLLDECAPGWEHKAEEGKRALDMLTYQGNILSLVYDDKYTIAGHHALLGDRYSGRPGEGMSAEEVHHWEAEHGFGLPLNSYNRTYDPYYDKLTRCWTKQVRQRTGLPFNE